VNESLTQLAQYNFNALCTLARFLDSRGYWTTKRDITIDVAETVHSLFEALAWADGSLHARECWLLEAVLQDEEHVRAHVRECFANGKAQNPVPGCLVAAALHDSIHQTFFAELFLNHLENLGRLIMMADATVSDLEQRAFQEHFSGLRGSIAPAGF
jgi:hypothetical protein